MSASPAPAQAAPPAETLPFPPGALARVRATARALLGCDHLAADAVQEALIAASRLPAPPAEPLGWLVHAVAFRARHLRRTLRRRAAHEDAAAHHCALHGDCDNPLHHAVAHELGAAIDAAIARLPAESREAIRLAGGGLDYAAIAARLGLPIGTVRSRLHRARRLLQAFLRHHAPEP